MKQVIFFDLDGTITDPMEGITNSVAYALAAYGISVEDKNTLCKFIGPPLKESFIRYYGFDNEKSEAAVWKYREYFKEKGIFENKVFAGVLEMLEHLKAAGKKVILATSKPTPYAIRILEHFGLRQYFDDVQGSNMDGTRVEKAEVIAYAMKQNDVTDPAVAIMVGDREHDIIGGKRCGMETAGVLFGYGSEEELEAQGADYIVADMKALERLLMQ